MVMIINNIITTQRQYTEKKNQKTNKTIEEKHNTESSIICQRHSNQQGVHHYGSKLLGCSLGADR